MREKVGFNKLEKSLKFHKNNGSSESVGRRSR